MKIKHFFDEDTFTLTYVAWDEATKDGIVIDPVLDFDPEENSTSFDSIDKVSHFIESEGIKLHYIMETHAHADHLSGSQELKNRFKGSKIVIGKEIMAVQETFKDFFKLDESFATDGSQFDQLLGDNDIIKAGSLEIKALHTPGHTPSCYSFVVEDSVFTGDALFMPDFGTGRCDFPKGSAEDMYTSIHEKLYSLPDETKFYTGHDYQPGGRELRYQSTIGESKKANIQLKAETTKDEFIKFRTERDSKLSEPKLLVPSIKVNIDAGHLTNQIS
ncbi:MBL fold metallo-hydrolase [bacterium]|nr:MBL fold metallo-hydrolase [bacterium]